MNLKEWGAHGRSWRGWERNDTNSVPIKFSKIKKSVFTGNIWQMAMLDWEKASGSDSSKGSAFLFTAGVSTGFYICFSWTTREGTMETSRATIYMCHGYLFVCGGIWMGQDTDDYETGSVGVIIQFYISGGYITLDCPQTLPLFQTVSFPYPLLNMLQKHIHFRSWGGLSAMSSRRVSTHPGRGKSLVAGSRQVSPFVCSPCSRLQTTLWLWPQHAENPGPEAFCPGNACQTLDNFSALLHPAQCFLPLS